MEKVLNKRKGHEAPTWKMIRRTRVTRRVSLIAAAVATTTAAQWLNYPAPGIPRLADVDYCRGAVVAPVLLPSVLACHSAAFSGWPQSR